MADRESRPVKEKRDGETQAESAVPGDDQARTVSPGEAVAAGADYVVIGRPIRLAADPAAAADRTAAEIAAGLS